MPDFICLTVGEQVFCTHRTTLTRYPRSRLGKIFIDDQQTSASFPDRSSDVFASIMCYLRGGKLKRPEHVTNELWLAELAFWQMDDI